MPVVLGVDGFVCRFYAGDHDPPHVHVFYSGSPAVIELDSGRARSNGLRTPDLAKARALVQAHRDELRAAWAAWQMKTKGENEHQDS
ncbi:MAG TPA: DUF4160 domain-containing protein [Longimicrobium sp.]|nr:DUF4160 domain-containing protein [Longimicrobium sp.]